MKRLRLIGLLPVALLLAGALAEAQPGPRGPGPAASAASGPRMGMGMMGRGRFGPDNTAGWAMMTPAERDAHRERMGTFKSRSECQAYMDEHHQLMSERAKERGRTPLAQPRRNACAGLPQ
jgi:hypothetical protein